LEHAEKCFRNQILYISKEEVYLPIDDIESEEESSKEELSNKDIPEELATPSLINQLLPEVTS
jgi:hypothetical protein